MTNKHLGDKMRKLVKLLGLWRRCLEILSDLRESRARQTHLHQP